MGDGAQEGRALAIAEFLPPLIVELRATITEFTAKMSEAKAEMESVAAKGASTFESMGAAGGVALAALGVAAAGVGVMALHAADQFETAHARLQTALANTGSSFDEYQGRIAAAEKAFEHLGYTHAEYENALARMTAALGSVDKAMADMGTAANVATFFHLSLERATTLVTKAAEGNSTALKRLGVDFTTTGDKAKDAAALMELLNQKYGGAAAAQAETFAGKMKALHATLTDLASSMGQMLIPVIEAVASKIGDVIHWFEEHRAVAAALAATIGGPLVAALVVYIVTQAKAFIGTAIEFVSNLANTIVTFLIPALGEATDVTWGLAAAEAAVTSGLSILVGVVSFLGFRWLSHTASVNDSAQAMTGLNTQTSDAINVTNQWTDSLDSSTSAVDSQDKAVVKLANSQKDQMADVTGLLGAQDALAKAQEHLSQLQREGGASVAEAARHTKDLETAEKSAQSATDNLTTAQDRLNTATDKLNRLKAGLGNAIAMDEVHAHHNLEQAKLSHDQAQTHLNDTVVKYGENSDEARQASLDLETATFNLTDAQEAFGHVGEKAWQDVDQAQKDVDTQTKAVTKATDDQATAQAHLNDVQHASPLHTLATDASDYSAALLDIVKKKDDVATAQDKFNQLSQIGSDNVGALRDHLVDLVKQSPGLGGQLNPVIQKLTDMITAAAPAANLMATGITGMLGALAGAGGPGGTEITPYPSPLTPAGLGLVSYPAAFEPMLNLVTGTHGIKSHQFGGTVEGPIGSPQLIMAHAGERVIPVGGSSGGINVGAIHVYAAAGMDTEALAEKVREKLLQAGRGLIGVGLS